MTLSLAEVSTLATQPTSDALSTLKVEWAKGGQDPFFLVMAMIAASNAVEAAEAAAAAKAAAKAEAATVAGADAETIAVASELPPEVKNLKAIKGWVYSLDSSLFIWSFTHEPTWRTGDRRDTNRRLQMLGGPGEVAKGSFQGL